MLKAIIPYRDIGMVTSPFEKCSFFQIVLAALLAAATATAAETEKPVLAADFENPRACARFLKHPHLERAAGAGVGGSAAMKAAYVGYPRGSKRIVFRIGLPAPLAEATLNYDVRFAEDFQFVRGGKLHGLGPARTITGGKPMRPDGWSARLMFKRGGGVNTYTYCQNKSGTYGTGGKRVRRFAFRKGRYHAVSLHVKVNDPAKADGFSHLYIDGEPVVIHNGVRFRAVGGDKTLICKFMFSTFHGGHSPAWAPKDKNGGYATVYAFFDNITVYPGKHVRKGPADRPPRRKNPAPVLPGFARGRGQK